MYSGVPAPADRWRRMTSDPCRCLFLSGDLSRLGEVTAAPGKPIAPSGEPGDKFMPLLESADERAVTLSADFER